MDNLVLMAPQVQLGLLGREALWECQANVERGACLACQALQELLENKVQQDHQGTKVLLGP